MGKSMNDRCAEYNKSGSEVGPMRGKTSGSPGTSLILLWQVWLSLFLPCRLRREVWGSPAFKAGDLGVTDCCTQINFSPTLWILGWRTGTLKVACWTRILYQMQKQNPLCYQEVTFLNSISLMITYCFPESAPKLFKRNSLSPCALRFASASPIPEVRAWSHSFGFGREIDNKGFFFVCLFVWTGCLYFCVKRKWWGLFPKVKL